MSWKTLSIGYEEVAGYSPVPSIRRRAFLSKLDIKTLFESKLVAFVYVSYKLSLLFLFFLAFLIHINMILLIAMIIVVPLFMSIVDNELYKWSCRRLAFEEPTSIFYDLKNSETDGWYSDPFANGIVNQERKWESGKWTEETRIHVP